MLLLFDDILFQAWLACVRLCDDRWCKCLLREVISHHNFSYATVYMQVTKRKCYIKHVTSNSNMLLKWSNKHNTVCRLDFCSDVHSERRNRPASRDDWRRTHQTTHCRQMENFRKSTLIKSFWLTKLLLFNIVTYFVAWGSTANLYAIDDFLFIVNYHALQIKLTKRYISVQSLNLIGNMF